MTDKQLLKIVTQFRKGFLGRQKPDLRCFEFSTALQGYLNMLGLETECTYGEIDGLFCCNHYWLTVPDGRILDGTGSQFNQYNDEEKHLPDVYLGEKPEWYIIP